MTNFWFLTQYAVSLTEAAQEQSEVSSQPLTGGEQAVVAVDSNTPPRSAAPRQQLPSMLIFIVAIMAMMYFILFREPRKKQKQQQQMVQSLKKNDRVRTIGGIIGTIVDVKEDEIVLKVDEANNTKIRIVPSAIGKNLTGDEK